MQISKVMFTDNRYKSKDFGNTITKNNSKIQEHVYTPRCENFLVFGSTVQNTLKRNICKGYKIQELTTAQFAELKNNIIKAKKNFPSFKPIEENKINFWNVQLLDYMLLHPQEYRKGFDDVTDDLAGLCTCVTNKESAEVVLEMLKMPWLLQNEEMKSRVGNIGFRTSVYNALDAKMQILNKLQEEHHKKPVVYSQNQFGTIGEILKYTKNKPGLKIAEIMIEYPEFLENNGINTHSFLERIGNEEKYGNIQLEILNKIISIPELNGQKRTFDFTTGVFWSASSNLEKEFTLKLLDNPELFETKSFREALFEMIDDYPRGKDENAKQIRATMKQIIDTIAEKPELFKSKKFNKQVGDLFLSSEHSQINADRNLYLIQSGYFDAK